MKQKHTRAKKARRASGFQQESESRGQTANRQAIREDLQPKKPHTFGLQVTRIQRVRSKKTDQFGNPIFKNIPHSDNN